MEMKAENSFRGSLWNDIDKISGLSEHGAVHPPDIQQI
jgi:hypothetical protein